jgi:hypothetical protein
MEDEERKPTLFDALVARAELALARSRDLVARAQTLAREHEAAGRRPVRCAWCGRIEIAGTWRPTDEVPAWFKVRRDPDSVSHGVCPACVADLRATGRSR